jgi:hypothetical protein
MKILVQWAQSTPTDWAAYDSSEWPLLAKRPEPKQNDAADASPGWVNAICVQGVVFQADHYHVENFANGNVRVTTWNDDPDDWRTTEYHGREILFAPLQPDTRFGGAYNTKQTWVTYAADRAGWQAAGKQGNTELREWAWFQAPQRDVAHGIWLDDALNAQHEAARSLRGWREWTEGVPADQLDDGILGQQRKRGSYNVPKGTRTYYNSDSNHSWTTHIAQQETDLLLTTAAPGNKTASVDATGTLAFLAVTPTAEPNNAAWPTGTYRYQIDAIAVGADLTYGLLIQGTGLGHFARVNTGVTLDLETHVQDEGAFTGTGLKLASYTGAWAAGSATDRFEILVAAVRVSGMGSQNLTLELNETDDFVDGPWPGDDFEDANFFGAGI